MIRRLRLIPKFIIAVYNYTGQQIITRHILPNLSRSKGNQGMKLGQLIGYNIRNIFFKDHAENEPEKLVPDFLFKKIFRLGENKCPAP